MKRFPTYVSMFTLCFCTVSSPSIADETTVKNCKAEDYERTINYRQGPDCLLSWIDNNQLQTVVWSQVEEDFQEASLHQSAIDLPVLTSSYWPELVDVDQDGWLDMITFETVGQVNGPFVIFFYDPVTKQFNQAEPIYGHTLERDMLGYVVTTGRSGPGWIYQFYTLANRELTFLFDVKPYGLGQSGGQFGEYCDVTLDYKQPLQIDDILTSNQIPDGEAFFAQYCDTRPSSDRETRAEPLQENHAFTDRVPDGTVFYCALEGSTKAVTIEHSPHTLFYTFGPVGGEAELELTRPLNEAEILPVINSGNARYGDVTFTNGAYDYVIYYSNEVSGEGDEAALTTSSSAFSNNAFTRGLVVYKDGDTTAPLFQSACDPERSYDAIFLAPSFQ